MNLTPTEIERLILFSAAEFARRNRARGIKLSHPEAVALIADEMLLAARSGMAYEDVVDLGGNLLTGDDVLPGVAEMVTVVSVEGSFPQGTKLIVVFDPIGPGKEASQTKAVPGQIITSDEDVELNAGRDRVEIEVVNCGDRDIQVRSHAHFFEVNRALKFDRRKAFGMRLDLPSGVGTRFEPGMKKTVTLVRMGGDRRVRGFAGLTDGQIDSVDTQRRAFDRARDRGYLTE